MVRTKLLVYVLEFGDTEDEAHFCDGKSLIRTYVCVYVCMCNSATPTAALSSNHVIRSVRGDLFC